MFWDENIRSAEPGHSSNHPETNNQSWPLKILGCYLVSFLGQFSAISVVAACFRNHVYIQNEHDWLENPNQLSQMYLQLKDTENPVIARES